jgi:hypothetical protein
LKPPKTPLGFNIATQIILRVGFNEGMLVMRSSLVLLLASLPCGVLAQSDRDWRLCSAVDADHLAIPACTRLIDSSAPSERDHATAYVIRGSAHWRQRDFDEAIADENGAIKIDPNLAAGYVARSAAYGSKEDDMDLSA